MPCRFDAVDNPELLPKVRTDLERVAAIGGRRS
jgi:hypothetical protein